MTRWRRPPASLSSAKGLIVSDDPGEFLRWKAALRVLYESLPPYDPAAPHVGRDGREIDPTRGFEPDDDPAAMADFLRTTGCILVRQDSGMKRSSPVLRFMPGSWRTAGVSGIPDDRETGVGIEAGPGDFSLHSGDGLYADPPRNAKNGRFRTSIVFEKGPIARAVGVGQESRSGTERPAIPRDRHEPASVDLPSPRRPERLDPSKRRSFRNWS